jgi:hypothetical protein
VAKLKTALALLLAAALLQGCASFDGRGLVPGKSTAAEVEALMGVPAERITVAGGDSVWFYPRQPAGLRTYAARLSPEGVLRDIDQRLTEENLKKIAIDATTAREVRELLGPPWRTTHLALSDRDAWDYRMYNSVQWEYILSVMFSSDGRVREVVMLRDYKVSGKGRGK